MRSLVIAGLLGAGCCGAAIMHPQSRQRLEAAVESMQKSKSQSSGASYEKKRPMS